MHIVTYNYKLKGAKYKVVNIEIIDKSRYTKNGIVCEVDDKKCG